MRFKIIILWLAIFFIPPVYADLHKASIVSPIDAMHNAQHHNNLGTIYFNQKDYFAAIKEYRIAIGINPNSQTTAIYYNNLGKVYQVLGGIQKTYALNTGGGGDFSQMAQKCFEQAILIDCMKLEYYQNLTETYQLTGVLESKKNYFLSNRNKNPFNVIPAALILAKQGQFEYSNMLLDDFVTENPDIIISRDLKKVIKENVEKSVVDF